MQGVMSRTAEGFNYSPTLSESRLIWSSETLEEYLANPTTLVRGTRMTQVLTMLTNDAPSSSF